MRGEEFERKEQREENKLWQIKRCPLNPVNHIVAEEVIKETDQT